MYNYYRENPNLQTVDPNIDLDGLTPIWESYKVNEQHLPTELYEEKFTFGGKNGLASSDFEGRGLWVIDFISGRKSCRALIQKVRSSIRYTKENVVYVGYRDLTLCYRDSSIVLCVQLCLVSL
jgi:hypothetical protein